MAIGTKPYEWMVKYTPQKEWIDRRGLMLWLAFFFLELGAGTFIVASIFNNLLTMFIGWLICAVGGGGFHLFYLGRPLRFWRILTSGKFSSSWISRGLTFVLVFLVLGGTHLLLALGGTSTLWLMIAADIFALFAVAYAGFALNFISAIPLWNTPLLPVLYTILGFWGGLGVTLLTMLAAGATAAMPNIQVWSQVFLVSFIFIVVIYLLGIRYQASFGKNSAVKTSVREIVIGRWAPLFWVMVVTFGMLLPLAVAINAWTIGLAVPVVFLSAVITLELLGDLAFRYCLLKNALYAPLIPL
ncbi:MAG: polysulfide reductase NrfD [Chloroflexi bacterium]|nr:polysulfide reductase NrfD [Chloroflexota bacterium]